MSELLIGCGNQREKRMWGPAGKEWSDLVTLDMDAACLPDYQHDLMRLPLPFPDDQFDEIHAYHVLEHTGAQGDYRWFFAQWSDFWRILKPKGVFFGIVPAAGSPWVWGDPGHTRHLPSEVFSFLNQPLYTENVGMNAMADYRWVYKADFDRVHTEVSADGHELSFAFMAVKPSRISIQ